MRRRAVAAGLAMMLSGVAAAHDLRGSLGGADTLTPSPRPVPPRWRGSFWEVPNGGLAIQVPRANLERDVAVVLTGASVPEMRQPVTARVEGGRCVPGTLVVAPGTTLTVDNEDLLAHEFYVVRAGQTEPVVASELTASRTRRQLSLPAAGAYELRDQRQPQFRCWIVAGPGQGRVLPVDRTGAFSVSGLEDGTYTVKAYFEGAERASGEVTVAGREATVTLSLGGEAAPAHEDTHRHRDH